MVAAELARLQERERFLESELREMQTRGLSAPGRLDEETVTTILGEEAARVLAAARDAAVEIRERAEDSATRMVKEAVEDASRIRDTAREEAARIREDINGDIEAEIELAKQQGRDLVLEARQYREKMLAELTRRRDAAKAQIDKLVHERDRLVAAFQRSKMTADEALAFLREARDDDEEYIFDFTRPPVANGDADKNGGAATTSTDTVTGSHTRAKKSGAGIFDYTKDIESTHIESTASESTASESTDAGTTGTSTPRGMPVLTKRPVFLGPQEDEVDSDAFGPIDLRPDDIEDVEVAGHEESLEQSDTDVPIVTPVSDFDVDPLVDDGVDVMTAAGPKAFAEDTTGVADIADADDSSEESDGHLATVVSLFGERRRPPHRGIDERDSATRTLDQARSQHPVTVLPDELEPAPTITAPEPSEATPRPTASVPEPTTTVPSRLDDIFARLRAGTTASVSEAAREAVATVAVRAPFVPTSDPKRLAKRAAALAPIIEDSESRLKRSFADDLNEILQRLAQKRLTLTVDNVVGTAAEHTARLAAPVSDVFRRAATEGAKSMKSARGSVRRVRGEALDTALRTALENLVVEPLRASIESAIAAAAGDKAVVVHAARAAHRDLKDRVASVAADLAHEGHAAGSLLSLEPGTKVCWVVDPDGPPCADGEDNSLAGAVACGEPFPTGDLRPLAHPGCRCVMAPDQH